MKKVLFIFSAALLSATAIMAQQYSAGLRTGTGYLIPQKNNEFLTNTFSNHYSWEKEAFVRRESKKHWAFELAISHSNSGGNSSSNSYSTCGVYEGGPLGTRYGQTFISSYAVNLSVQYKIAFGIFKSNPVLRHIRSYAGIRLSPTWMTVKGNYHFDPTINSSAYAYNQEDHTRVLWGSFIHTFSYDVTRHLSFSSLAAFSISGDYFGRYMAWPAEQPRGKISLQLGAAYRF